MAIKGIVEQSNVNDFGFAGIKVNGTWYGSDKKGTKPPPKGAMVMFDAYAKEAKNGNTYNHFKAQSLKTKAGSAPAASAPAASGGGNRDTYWSDKAASDAQREPRIAYQGALERAIQFVDLAIRNEAVTALAKAKPTAKLEIIAALVKEQADKFFVESWNATAPKADAKPAKEAEEETTDEPEETEAEETEETTEGEDWS